MPLFEFCCLAALQVTGGETITSVCLMCLEGHGDFDGQRTILGTFKCDVPGGRGEILNVFFQRTSLMEHQFPYSCAASLRYIQFRQYF